MTRLRFIYSLLFALALFGCRGQKDGQVEDAAKTPEIEVAQVATQSGPVTAVVKLSPKNPKLGDRLTLTLEVAADEGVEVRMPAFGEALGRFAILDFAPKKTRNDDGKTIYEQRYNLDSPMSGIRTIPPLRIEFTDSRTGADEEIHELLTDKITVKIESVLDEAALSKGLKPPRPKLPKRLTGQTSMIMIIAAGLAALAGIAALIVWQRKRHARQVRISAFDKAMKRLRKIEEVGIPEGDEADQWYVELSGIIRLYIEERYGLKAPELTTQEFIGVAGASAEIKKDHKVLLRKFLEQCDRVKFAEYRPGKQESAEAVQAAKRFLEETRLTDGKAEVGD